MSRHVRKRKSEDIHAKLQTKRILSSGRAALQRSARIGAYFDSDTISGAMHGPLSIACEAWVILVAPDGLPLPRADGPSQRTARAANIAIRQLPNHTSVLGHFSPDAIT